MGLNVRFTVAVIAIIIMGFSASAYIFSSESIGELTDSVGIVMIDKSQYIEKIDECVSAQTVGNVALNSFTHKWAAEYKIKIQEANTPDEIDVLMNEFYTIVSSCKQ
jgi:hypothetical protein